MNIFLNSKYFRNLEVVSVLLIVGVIVQLFLFFRLPKDIVRSEQDKNTALQTSMNSVLSIKASSNDGFNELLASRDIFNPIKRVLLEQTTAPVSLKPEAPPRDPEVLPVHLKVVAVVADKKFQVVIEDLNLKQTFFIDRGVERDGFRIDRVEGKKVFLIYQGAEYVIPFGR
jgi:hypothetical protein